jgi:hypothetical protein
MAKEPNRSVNTKQDLGSIDAIQHNDAVGAKKVMVVQPTPQRTCAANEAVGAGKLILIAATSYNLVMTGRDYDTAKVYQQGDIAVNGGVVYLCQQDQVTGTFDATKWSAKAASTISAIPCANPSVVSTGRWHNSISVAGFLIDDESSIGYNRIRD